MHRALMKRKLWCVLISMTCIIAATLLGTQAYALQITGEDFASEETSEERQKEYLLYQEDDKKIETKYLQTEANIQHYAYLNFEKASEELKPVILAARNRIICRYSWVADGISGRILDKNGNLKEELPQFSELFPEDWEEPVCPVVVDLSYYKPQQ